MARFSVLSHETKSLFWGAPKPGRVWMVHITVAVVMRTAVRGAHILGTDRSKTAFRVFVVRRSAACRPRYL